MSDDLWPEQVGDWGEEPPPDDYPSVPSTNVERDQYNADRQYFTFYNAAVKALRSRRASAETVSAQLKRFVAPEGLAARVELLESDRLLVLICATTVEQCGQASAARFLIDRLNERRPPGRQLSFQEPLPTDDQRLSEPLIDATRLGLFFNFVGRERDEVESRIDELTGLADELAAAESFAVVAVGGTFGEQAEKWLPKRTHRLGRPAPEEVFRRHAPGLGTLLDDPWLHRELLPAWPPAVANVAKQATSIYQSGTTQAEDIVRRLRAGRTDWTAQVREDLEKHSTASRRALLLSAALLDGSGAVKVVAARDLLLEVSRHPGDPAHLLERRDAVAEVECLGQIEPLTAKFTRIGYGPTLLRLIWQYQPALRPALIDWWQRIPTALNAQDPADLGPLIESLTTLAEAERDEQIAVRVARGWTPPRPKPGSATQGVNTQNRIAAVLLLQRACLSRTIGGKTRRWLYETAYYRNSYPQFRAVLAEVVGLFDPDHQSEAMTRLKHLGKDANPEVTNAVIRSVTVLARDMKLAELIGYLTDWLSASRPGARTAADIVSTVLRQPLDPETDFASPVFVRFWRSALSTLPDDQAAGLVHDWLRLGAGSPAHRGPLFQILLLAAGNDLRRQGRLYYATRATDDEELAEIFAGFRARLDQTTPEWIF